MGTDFYPTVREIMDRTIPGPEPWHLHYHLLTSLKSLLDWTAGKEDIDGPTLEFQIQNTLEPWVAQYLRPRTGRTRKHFAAALREMIERARRSRQTGSHDIEVLHRFYSDLARCDKALAVLSERVRDIFKGCTNRERLLLMALARMEQMSDYHEDVDLMMRMRAATSPLHDAGQFLETKAETLAKDPELAELVNFIKCADELIEVTLGGTLF
jgi:hypothetical protein